MPIKTTTLLDAVIAAQQACQHLTDQATSIDEMLDHLDGILEQIYFTLGLPDEVKTALNAAIGEFGDVSNTAADLDLSHLETLLDDLRRTVEQSQ